MFHGHLYYFQKPPLEGRPNTKLGDHSTPNAHNHWLIPSYYHVWRPAWIEIIFGWGHDHIQLHTTLEDPWPHYMILRGVLGWPLDTFFWALTFSWSLVLAHVWSGPYTPLKSSCTPVDICACNSNVHMQKFFRTPPQDLHAWLIWKLN
jgi:hypothetical protein